MKLNLDSKWQAILADEIEKPIFHDLIKVWMKNINLFIRKGVCFSLLIMQFQRVK
jgi:hypothetical protein